MDKEELDKLWNNPNNYKGNYAIYHCKKDPRVVVPKRQKWTGWTLNFAHPMAYGVLISIFVITLLPAAITLFIWPKTEISVVAALLLGGALVVAYCLKINSLIE